MSLRSSGFSEPNLSWESRPGISCLARPNKPRKKLLPSSTPSTCASLSCLTSRRLSLSGRNRLWLAVGDQGMDVLNRQSWIGLVEADRGAVCAGCKVNEFLQMFSARRGRRVLGELENQVEDWSDILGEVSNVLVE